MENAVVTSIKRDFLHQNFILGSEATRIVAAGARFLKVHSIPSSKFHFWGPIHGARAFRTFILPLQSMKRSTAFVHPSSPERFHTSLEIMEPCIQRKVKMMMMICPPMCGRTRGRIPLYKFQVKKYRISLTQAQYTSQMPAEVEQGSGRSNDVLEFSIPFSSQSVNITASNGYAVRPILEICIPLRLRKMYSIYNGRLTH